MNSKPEVLAFFEEDTSTFSYIVKDPTTDKCAVIDSVLNFDYASGTVKYDHADQIIASVREQQFEVILHIETHVHADHLSAAPYIRSILGGKIAISRHIQTVQETFGHLLNEGDEFPRDGRQFDILFEDNQTYSIGNLQGQAMPTPGHTPACMTHLIGDAAFVGDTIFLPDVGTARTDFPGGDARTLYQSIQRIFALPEDTRLFMCHDYPPPGRSPSYETSVRMERQQNIHIHTAISEDEFIRFRQKRDKTLAMPELIYPSLQVNIRAGQFPVPEDNGKVYLKVPVSGLKKL